MELPHHRPAPHSPPPISLKSPADGDLKRRPILPITFSNGALKKPRPAFSAGLYRECMKNHAAAIGGHALDGCGEFMASPSATPADPSSLLCAACGCHRNFHRRLFSADNLPEEHDDDGGDEAVDDDEDCHVTTPPPQFYSAPHMLMALSAGIGGGGRDSSGGGAHRKRFRTKFTAEQKEKMQRLSEKLGWRMQKRDDVMVEQSCREIGVSRGVFKVWMHNNKHNFVGGPSSRRSAGGSGGAAASLVAGGESSGADRRPGDSPSPSSAEP